MRKLAGRHGSTHQAGTSTFARQDVNPALVIHLVVLAIAAAKS